MSYHVRDWVMMNRDGLDARPRQHRMTVVDSGRSSGFTAISAVFPDIADELRKTMPGAYEVVDAIVASEAGRERLKMPALFNFKGKTAECERCGNEFPLMDRKKARRRFCKQECKQEHEEWLRKRNGNAPVPHQCSASCQEHYEQELQERYGNMDHLRIKRGRKRKQAGNG